jgi:CRP-like cAMP-binding protein
MAGEYVTQFELEDDLNHFVVHEKHLQSFRNALIPLEFNNGDFIIHQGDFGDTMYFIVKGRVSVQVEMQNGEREEVNKLCSGDYFGERALVMKKLRNAHCVAVGGVKVYALSNDKFLGLPNDLLTV